jgi:predicted dehydrogenase
MIETNLKWVVLGCGSIANEMAKVLMLRGIHFYGVCNRTYAKAQDFAKKYHVEKVYKDVQDVWKDPEVDIVYVATSQNTHYEYIKSALINGKHVLVEKAITLNSSQLDEMMELSDKKGLMLAEAMTIYHMPLIDKIASYLVQEKMGKVQLLTLNFGSFKEYNLKNRFYNLELGGGALLDIGVYALSFARAFMEQKPNEVKSFCRKSETGSYEMSTIILKNKCGQMATVALSIH